MKRTWIKAAVIALVGEKHSSVDEFADDVIRVPEISNILMPSLTAHLTGAAASRGQSLTNDSLISLWNMPRSPS